MGKVNKFWRQSIKMSNLRVERMQVDMKLTPYVIPINILEFLILWDIGLPSREHSIAPVSMHQSQLQ